VRATLSKNDRLHLQKRIDYLFAAGKSAVSYPIRVVAVPAADDLLDVREVEPALQTLFSVAKKRFKRAVQRNRHKRRMREAYRLEKAVADWNPSTPVWLALQYIGNEEIPLPELRAAIRKAVEKGLDLAHESTPSRP
jgi:ribonuclease P protein component